MHQAKSTFLLTYTPPVYTDSSKQHSVIQYELSTTKAIFDDEDDDDNDDDDDEEEEEQKRRIKLMTLYDDGECSGNSNVEEEEEDDEAIPITAIRRRTMKRVFMHTHRPTATRPCPVSRPHTGPRRWTR